MRSNGIERSHASGSAIVATGLRKTYGGLTVLDGVELDIADGSIFALLGPNGAGKSTAVRILATLIRADDGDIRVGGHSVTDEPDAVRRAIAVTGQFSAVDKLLTGSENLELMGDLHRLPRAETRRRAAELLERFELVEAADRYAATYSGGTTRRLDLAMGLMGNPRIIFLDEPTTGLDPRSRNTMWQMVRDLAADGATVFLTTQNLEEADALADRIAVLDGGRVVAEGTPAELKQLIPGGHVTLRFSGAAPIEAAAGLLQDAVRDDDALTLQVPSDGSFTSLRTLIDGLAGTANSVESLSIHTPDLDDVFFALTGACDPGAADVPGNLKVSKS
ncbi:MAG: ATP-binding cassette domain-containing protein [Trebonia sp.]